MLEKIGSPKDLRNLDKSELNKLTQEIREYLIDTVSKTGGHLGPNLGVVEITMAIHRVFDSPNDAVVFDTGHQSYVHKLLTGRQDFSALRQAGGIAGYPQRSESEHDVVENSHASTSLSWADGISRAFKATGQTDRHVVALIGDGALTGGMAWEALNNITDDNDRNLVIIVNDNGRSYAPTIGGLARGLSNIRTEPWYREGYRISKRVFSLLGPIGRVLFNASHAFLDSILSFGVPKGIFPNLDIKHLGPIDGHNLEELESVLKQAKTLGQPVIVHAITQKGRGYTPALEDQADQFHAVGKINPESGLPIKASSEPSWTSVFGDELVKLADKNEKLVGITGAMLIPVGMDALADKYPDRVFDVGIAEQHAVTAAAGMAFGGLHPVVAVYSTFLNRAFDQVLMDVALHKAGVTFVLDRAGVTGPDGASHHGMWDMSMLQVVPGIQIAAPRDESALRVNLGEATMIEDAPSVIRFPKGSVARPLPALRRLEHGADLLRDTDTQDVLLVGVGPFAHLAMRVANLLEQQGIGSTVVDPRWILPINRDLVELAAKHRLVVTLEDGVRVGGFGSRLRQSLRESQIDTGLHEVGIPAEFLEHAERDEILERLGLTDKQIAMEVVEQVVGTRVPKAKPLLAQEQQDQPQ
ncbi:MAG: 1-deoxy-D-xylulose-5-phosphate synthase [Candidatus Aquiluna sp. XM-24bin5]|nr:MAG: 1-deoxy-D-xylulose-5-phosphate synthase [Candidatus Aquiluna sp. XM-24bin5]